MCFRYTTLDQVPDKTAAALGVALPRIARAVMKVNISFSARNYFLFYTCVQLFLLCLLSIFLKYQKIGNRVQILQHFAKQWKNCTPGVHMLITMRLALEILTLNLMQCTCTYLNLPCLSTPLGRPARPFPHHTQVRRRATW